MNQIDGFSFLTPEEIKKVFSRFKKENPNPQSELSAPNAYAFLVSVILSAQATDVSVNKATVELFKTADTPQKIIALGETRLIEYIKSIGLYRNKAKNIIAMSNMLVEKFGGNIPHTREDLESLPGVGRKTANVVLNVIYGESVMPVDTHLLRISPRMGLSCGTTPKDVERDLLEKIPKTYLHHAHHWLILHGRYVCTARKPQCGECIINDICPRNGVL